MSIIGNAIMVGGGGGHASILVLGAKNETVSYQGGAGGTVTLDSNGNGTLTIPYGAYIFSGSVSGYVTNQIAVTQSTSVIYVRPVGTIYWYGAVVARLIPHLESEMTYYDTYFDWKFSGSSWVRLQTDQRGAGYTDCTIRAKGLASSSSCKLGYGSADNPSDIPNVTLSLSSSFTDFTLSFTPDSSGSVIAIHGNPYGERHVTVSEWYMGDR